MMNRLYYRDWMGKKKNGGLSEVEADAQFDAFADEKPHLTDQKGAGKNKL